MAFEKAEAPKGKAPTQYVKLVSTHKGGLCLPPVVKKVGDDFKTEYVGVQLHYGDNHVDAAHWNAVKAQSPITHWMEAGMLREADDAADAKPKTPTCRESLDGMSASIAEKYIEETTDRELLMKWQKSRCNAEVRALIVARFEALAK